MKLKSILFTPIAIVAYAGGLAAQESRSDGWAFWGGQSLPEQELDQAYRLPVKGYDTRVYEWTPKGSPETVCVAQFSSSGPVGMQCFPKKP